VRLGINSRRPRDVTCSHCTPDSHLASLCQKCFSPSSPPHICRGLGVEATFIWPSSRLIPLHSLPAHFLHFRNMSIPFRVRIFSSSPTGSENPFFSTDSPAVFLWLLAYTPLSKNVGPSDFPSFPQVGCFPMHFFTLLNERLVDFIFHAAKFQLFLRCPSSVISHQVHNSF